MSEAETATATVAQDDARAPAAGTDTSHDAGAEAGHDAPVAAAPRPVTLSRAQLAAWLVAAAGGAALATALVMSFTGATRAREEIAALEKSIATLRDEKQALQTKFDAFSATVQARAIAELRCEVIDGMVDCLAAGFKRPERFAESDRQYFATRCTELGAGNAAAPATEHGDAPATSGGTPIGATGKPGAAKAVVPSAAPPPAAASEPRPRPLNVREFADELRKIPGVAVDGNARRNAER